MASAAAWEGMVVRPHHKVFDFDCKHLCHQDPGNHIGMSIRYLFLLYFRQDSHNNNIDQNCHIRAYKAYRVDNLRLALYSSPRVYLEILLYFLHSQIL